MTATAVWNSIQRAAAALVEIVTSGTTATEWMQFSGILIVGAIIGYILHKILQGPVLKMINRLPITGAHRLLTPIRMAVLGLFGIEVLRLGTNVFPHLPPWLWMEKERLASFLTGLLIALTIFLFAMRLVDLFVEGLRQKWSNSEARIDHSVATTIGMGIKILLVLFIGVVLLQNVGYQVTGLIAGLGFLGATLALAAQHTIANGIGYFEILFGRLFKTGDFISFSDRTGFVTNIGLRNVEIQSIQGERITVPNKELVDKVIRNFTRGRFHRLTCEIGLTYSHNRAKIEEAVQILAEIFKAQPDVESHETVFLSFGESSLDLQVIYWAQFRTEPEYNSILTRVHLAIKERFDQAGIDFAFPTRTVIVQGNSAVIPPA